MSTNVAPSKDLSTADASFLVQCLQHSLSSMVINVPAIAQTLETKPHNVTCRVSNLRKRYGLNITCTSSSTESPSPAKTKTRPVAKPTPVEKPAAEIEEGRKSGGTAGQAGVAKPATKRKANGEDEGRKVERKKKAQPIQKASAGASEDEDDSEDENAGNK